MHRALEDCHFEVLDGAFSGALAYVKPRSRMISGARDRRSNVRDEQMSKTLSDPRGQKAPWPRGIGVVPNAKDREARLTASMA